VAHGQDARATDLPYTEEAGETKWFLYILADQKIVEEPIQIIDAIRCPRETPRNGEIERSTLAEIRASVEKHIKNTRLKAMQAPISVRPILKCWMELN
jgi:hypothetical protein